MGFIIITLSLVFIIFILITLFQEMKFLRDHLKLKSDIIDRLHQENICLKNKLGRINSIYHEE